MSRDSALGAQPSSDAGRHTGPAASAGQSDGRRMLRFADTLRRRSGSRGTKALLFQLLGGLTEGISILLLVPILQFVDTVGGSATIRLPDSILPGYLGGSEIALSTILVALILLVTAQALFNRIKTIYVSDLLQSYVNGMRTDLFAALAGARWDAIVRRREADLTHALTSDIERLQICAVCTLALAQIVVMQGVYFAVSLAVSPSMTLVAAIVGIAMLVILQPLRRRAHAFGTRLTANRKEQFRTVSDFLTGMKVAKSLNVEPVYVDRLRGTLLQMQADSRRFNRVATWGTAMFQILSVVGLAVFIFVAVERADLPLSQLVVLLVIFMRVAPRFMDMQSYLQQMLTALPAYEAVEHLRRELEAMPERGGGEIGQKAPPPNLTASIEIEGLSFTHRGSGGPPAIDDVSFAIPAGQVTALIGPSGSGKSTLVDLVLGLLTPTGGTIAVDGMVLDEDNRREWRNRVAFVPQDVFLLHDTIAANLRLGAPDADEAQLREALGSAQALAFVDALPEGMDTVVGERGVRLSGGERQRIALARALLRRPALLILDEATSALDYQNQALIAEAVSGMKGSLTIITIAHRPSMIAFADTVVALEQGRIVESGSYAALAADPRTRLSRMVATEGAGHLASERVGGEDRSA